MDKPVWLKDVDDFHPGILSFPLNGFGASPFDISKDGVLPLQHLDYQRNPFPSRSILAVSVFFRLHFFFGLHFDKTDDMKIIQFAE